MGFHAAATKGGDGRCGHHDWAQHHAARLKGWHDEHATHVTARNASVLGVGGVSWRSRRNRICS